VRRMGPKCDDIGMVIDSVALPLLGTLSPRQARRCASAMLKRLGVGGCAEDRWEDLTDGERTLVALAHALVRGPRLLIADDPTANLDVLQREEVTRLLREAADEQALGVLITVPDMPHMAYADRVGSLCDGRLTMSGEPAGGDVIDIRARQQSV
jgi:putative ABC transport system ATP-binding protein